MWNGTDWPEGAYLIDQLRGKWEAPELIRKARDFYNARTSPDNRGFLTGMKIEDKASGIGLIQTLKSEGGISVVGIPRSKDKVERANGVLMAIESGRVHLPKNKPWIKEYRA